MARSMQSDRFFWQKQREAERPSGSSGASFEESRPKCGRVSSGWSEWATADGRAVATILHDLF